MSRQAYARYRDTTFHKIVHLTFASYAKSSVAPSQFLADMEGMGMKEKYEKQTMQEISLRINQLQKLDEEIQKCQKIVTPRLNTVAAPTVVESSP